MAVVVITGASSGIGEATARRLAESGYRLVLAARRADRLEALAAELSPLTRVLVVPTDVADPQSLEQLARRAGEHFGAIDVWINNAGVGGPPVWWEASPEQIQRVLSTNLTAPILGARAALPWLRKSRRPLIINIASVAGHIGTAGIYSATKFGLRGHTEALRRELVQFGIRVSLVSPGFVRTEMTRDVPLRMPSADLVARVIARLIEHPRNEVVVPGWYRVFILLNALLPWLTDRILERRHHGRAGAGE